MTNEQIRKRYLLHALLHKFTEQLFFAFGALLVYAKTGSVLNTLLFVVIGNISSLLMKSLGFNPSIKLFKEWGLILSMTLGLVLKVVALVGIFYLAPGYHYFYLLLFSLHVIENIGNTLYVIGASAVMVEVIGTSVMPGRSSAQIKMLHTVSGLMAALVGIFMSAHGSFLYLFLIGGIVLLGSTIPLVGIPTPKLPLFSFRKNLQTISPAMFFANVNPDHQFKVTGLPLIILAISASLDISIWVSAGVAVVSIITAYVAGWVKDHHGTWLICVALGIGIASWVAYGFVSSPIAFLLVSILVGLATEVLGVSREAQMGIDLRGNVLGGTMAFEFARSIGIVIGSSILLIAYLVAGNLPQLMLVMGGLFLIPKALYAVGSAKNET